MKSDLFKKKIKTVIMLQINDLRFGNLVTWVDEKDDYPLTISGILSKEVVFVELGMGRWRNR